MTALRVSYRLLLVLVIAVAMFTACGRKRARVAKPPRVGTTATGMASWYGPPYHGRRSANGEVYDMEKLTAAHRTYAFDTWVRVRNLDNGKEIDVRITDRGPFVRGRIIDLSKAAARDIDMIGPGVAKVKLKVIDARDAIVPPVQATSPTIGPKPPLIGPVEAAPPPAPVTAELFGVQIGAFRDRARAEQLRASLEARYGKASLTLRDAQIPTWRVIVGEYPDEGSAQVAASTLRLDFPEAFVVREDAPTVQ
jgi:rare lipoprotein A